MTVAQLIKELQTFQPDSEVIVAVPVGADFQSAPVGVAYWETDAHKVIIEGQQD